MLSYWMLWIKLIIKHCVSCWITDILQNDTRSIQYQINAESFRVLRITVFVLSFWYTDLHDSIIYGDIKMAFRLFLRSKRKHLMWRSGLSVHLFVFARDLSTTILSDFHENRLGNIHRLLKCVNKYLMVISICRDWIGYSWAGTKDFYVMPFRNYESGEKRFSETSILLRGGWWNFGSIFYILLRGVDEILAVYSTFYLGVDEILAVYSTFYLGVDEILAVYSTFYLGVDKILAVYSTFYLGVDEILAVYSTFYLGGLMKFWPYILILLKGWWNFGRIFYILLRGLMKFWPYILHFT